MLGPVIDGSRGRRPDHRLPLVDLRGGLEAAEASGGAASLHVRVLQEVDGKRSVVSHMAKKTRGEVARALLLADGIETVQDALEALRESFEVEERQGPST